MRIEFTTKLQGQPCRMIVQETHPKTAEPGLFAWFDPFDGPEHAFQVTDQMLKFFRLWEIPRKNDC
jgi:hypothetical protein